MLMSVSVAVSPAVLRWAVERSGREPGAFEKRFPYWQQWVDAAKSPTIHQLEELASFAHLPFGAFFLEHPPEPELPIPDYRIGTQGDRSTPSQDLLEVIETSQLRQDWLREYAVAHDLGEAKVTRLSSDSIRRRIRCDHHRRPAFQRREPRAHDP